MFVDTVSIQLSAGKGGNGVIAWRREKYIPKGGPAGGDGGHGASVIFEADPQIPSLEALRNRAIIKAEDGMPGGPNNRTGKNGRDLVLKVPVGTLIKDATTKAILCDLTESGQTWKVCQGGKGGKGNSRFKTSTHQAPFICTPGTPGEDLDVDLELKLIADIGLVGMPNAGKSTLISKLAYLEVKIAPYPFTTLRPNLGIIQDAQEKFLIADIPGLIEKASENKGLGFAFLRHVERTSVLLFVIELAPYQERDALEEFLMLRKELAVYNPELLEKPFLVALNKIDQEETAPLAKSFRENYPFDPATLFEISALQRLNLEALKLRACELVREVKKAVSSSPSDPHHSENGLGYETLDAIIESRNQFAPSHTD
jgi:GTP-binding protein